MIRARATAPGKLVMVGEYAVLHGGPAIVSAVGRRAVAELHTDVAASELHVLNDDQRYRFDIRDQQVHWQDHPGEQGALLEAAVGVLTNQGMDVAGLAPFALQLDSREFYAADARKLGLGSSAAVAVALTGCLQQALSGTTDCETALAVHRKFQHNHGSGIDVYASYHGGTLSMRKGDVHALTWPLEVHRVPVWTGVAASTPDLLKRLKEFALARPKQHAALLAELSAQAAKVVAACENAVTLPAALSVFAAALHELDDASELGIWSAEHLRLERLAASLELTYKPSGAGGGDFGLAVGTDPDALQEFRAGAEQAGFGAGDWEWGVDGLTLR